MHIMYEIIIMAKWYLTMKKFIKCVAVAIIFTEAFFVGVAASDELKNR